MNNIREMVRGDFANMSLMKSGNGSFYINDQNVTEETYELVLFIQEYVRFSVESYYRGQGEK